MTRRALTFIGFVPRGDGFAAQIGMDDALSMTSDLPASLQTATRLYKDRLRHLRNLVRKINTRKLERKPLRTRQMWDLGDGIVSLTAQLAGLSLQLDDLYAHLTRDLGVKRMWLEKVIIFRRHLPKRELIPSDLNWGRCSSAPRRTAENLLKGITPE